MAEKIPMEKYYQAKDIEAKWQAFWEDKKIYSFCDDPTLPVYSIDTPPPTVSGEIHMGHVFSYVQAEVIARFWRMKGYNIFYPFCFDDNGLPTERLVEKENNVKAAEMERPLFIKLCLKVTEEFEAKFKKFWKNLGFSVSWDLQYNTINTLCRRIAQKSFIELYKNGEVYRKEAPTLWCTDPGCQTAIAQAEVTDVQSESLFVTIPFKIKGGGEIKIATTRPELLPACVAVFYHPEDERYQKYKGATAISPLFNQEIPVLSDPKANPLKGTGIVMCCTFGDTTDIAWWQEHHLDLKIVIDKNGLLNEKAGQWKGYPIKEARKAIIEELKKQGLVEKEEPTIHEVQAHERCNTELEFLVTKQWFVRLLDTEDKERKKAWLEAGDKIKWYPPYMKVRYQDWVNNLKWDWCISRQRYFGVPFPLWYCKKCGEVKLADERHLPVDPLESSPNEKCSCGSDSFEGERDVFDTWHTSSLTPLINCKWGESRNLTQVIYPMSLRPQAHDIIRTWTFYTIVKGMLHTRKPPWESVMISGHTLGADGKKLSKRFGNFVDPQDTLNNFSADVIRYWATSTQLGSDCRYSEKEMEIGKRLCTKLWNAARFAFHHLAGYSKEWTSSLEGIDRWILAHLAKVVRTVTEGLENYEFSVARHETEQFFWHKFCDNYLEIIKDRLYNPDKRGKDKLISAQFGLYNSFLGILKLFAPILPHITEELFQLYYARLEENKSIHISRWPRAMERFKDDDIALTGDKAVAVISRVRRFKTENKSYLKTALSKLIISCSESESSALSQMIGDIYSATSAKEINFVLSGEGDQEFLDTDQPGVKIKPIL